MLPFLKRIYPLRILFCTTLCEDQPCLSCSGSRFAAVPEVLQARRRSNCLGCRKCSKQRGNEVMVTSGDSSECARGAPVFRLFMEEQEEAVAARGWQRAVVDLDLLKNCLWLRKLDRKETEMGSEIRFRHRWQRGTRNALVSKGRKGRKSTKTPRWGLGGEWRI